MNGETFVSKDAMRRIISDIKEIMVNPLTSHGIFYEHDETDMLKGRALIIGPADTPYADGFYLFKFQFPANYPHVPPKVEFCTHDGYTRFNPYNAIIQYKNIEVAIFGMLASVAGASVAEASTSVLGASVSEFAIFGDYMREHFQKNKEKIRLRIVDIIKNGGEQLYSINVYKMAVQTNYSELLDRFF